MTVRRNTTPTASGAQVTFQSRALSNIWRLWASNTSEKMLEIVMGLNRWLFVVLFYARVSTSCDNVTEAVHVKMNSIVYASILYFSHAWSVECGGRQNIRQGVLTLLVRRVWYYGIVRQKLKGPLRNKILLDQVNGRSVFSNLHQGFLRYHIILRQPIRVSLLILTGMFIV